LIYDRFVAKIAFSTIASKRFTKQNAKQNDLSAFLPYFCVEIAVNKTTYKIEKVFSFHLS
jgi:hypothetical protein